MENRITAATRLELATLFCALALLIGFLIGCGTEDLTFPGDFPATVTGAPTATNTPTDDEE